MHTGIVSLIVTGILALGAAWTATASDATAKIDVLCDSLIAKISVPPAKNRIAVIPFTNKTGRPDNGRSVAVAERIIAYLQGKEVFVPVDREQFQKAMAEIALSQSGAVSDSSALEAGKFLAADFLLTGTIADAFGSTMLSAKIIQTETGKIAASASAPIAPAALDGLQKELLGEKGSVGASLFRSMVVPGWGQFYADKPARGVISLVLFLGAAGYLGFRSYQTSTTHRAYDDEYNSVQSLLNNDADGLLREVKAAMAGDGLDSSSDNYGSYLDRIFSGHLNDIQEKEDDYSAAYDQLAIAGIIIGGVWALNMVDAGIAGSQSKRKFKLYFSTNGIDRLGCSLALRF